MTIAQIILAVAARYGLSPADMTGPSKARVVSRPRQIAMFLAREMAGASYPRLARAFARRDHVTVMHACRVVAERMDTSPEHDAEMREIAASLMVARAT